MFDQKGIWVNLEARPLMLCLLNDLLVLPIRFQCFSEVSYIWCDVCCDMWPTLWSIMGSGSCSFGFTEFSVCTHSIGRLIKACKHTNINQSVFFRQVPELHPRILSRRNDLKYFSHSVIKTVTRRGPTMSVSESNREYSNCKGIMLCNRPAISEIQGTSVKLVITLLFSSWLQLCRAAAQVFSFMTGKLRSSGNSDAGAFTCGVIAQSIGMNSISLNRSKVNHYCSLILIT